MNPGVEVGVEQGCSTVSVLCLGCGCVVLLAVMTAAIGLDYLICVRVLPCFSACGILRQVYGSDLCLPAIEDARRNARTNGIDNCEFVCGKVSPPLPSRLNFSYTSTPYPFLSESQKYFPARTSFLCHSRPGR